MRSPRHAALFSFRFSVFPLLLAALCPAQTPAVTGFSPRALPAGTPDTPLSVFGAGFVSGSLVSFRVGSTSRLLPATFVSAFRLDVVVPAAGLSALGTGTVSVSAPSGATSSAVTLRIEEPSIYSAQPFVAKAGDPPFRLRVTGTQTLDAQVPSSLLALPRTVRLRVRNPGEFTTVDPICFLAVAPVFTTAIRAISPVSIPASTGTRAPTSPAPRPPRAIRFRVGDGAQLKRLPPLCHRRSVV